MTRVRRKKRWYAGKTSDPFSGMSVETSERKGPSERGWSTWGGGELWYPFPPQPNSNPFKTFINYIFTMT